MGLTKTEFSIKISQFFVLEENRTDAKVKEAYNHLPEYSLMHKVWFYSTARRDLSIKRGTAQHIELLEPLLKEIA